MPDVIHSLSLWCCAVSFSVDWTLLLYANVLELSQLIERRSLFHDHMNEIYVICHCTPVFSYQQSHMLLMSDTRRSDCILQLLIWICVSSAAQCAFTRGNERIPQRLVKDSVEHDDVSRRSGSILIIAFLLLDWYISLHIPSCWCSWLDTWERKRVGMEKMESFNRWIKIILMFCFFLTSYQQDD